MLFSVLLYFSLSLTWPDSVWLGRGDQEVRRHDFVWNLLRCPMFHCETEGHLAGAPVEPGTPNGWQPQRASEWAARPCSETEVLEWWGANCKTQWRKLDRLGFQTRRDCRRGERGSGDGRGGVRWVDRGEWGRQGSLGRRMSWGRRKEDQSKRSMVEEGKSETSGGCSWWRRQRRRGLRVRKQEVLPLTGLTSQEKDFYTAKSIIHLASKNCSI